MDEKIVKVPAHELESGMECKVKGGSDIVEDVETDYANGWTMVCLAQRGEQFVPMGTMIKVMS